MKTHLANLASVEPAPNWGSRTALEDKEERQLAKAVGIRQFGVNHLTLQPGSQSARRHWHEEEDEFVYVLSGCVVLRDDNGEIELATGAFVGFPSGNPNAHHIINRSSEPAALLVVGTRKVGEERIHYPDDPNPGPFKLVRDQYGHRIDQG